MSADYVAPMVPESLADRVFKITSPVVTHYRSDLDLDRAWIDGNPGIPFLVFARECGTWLVPLWPASSDHFPPPGERVPFLFGTADREHLLRSSVDLVEACICPLKSDHKLAVYSAGNGRASQCDFERARAIVRDYAARVRREWARPAPAPVQWREEHCGGAFDGFSVSSDADSGL